MLITPANLQAMFTAFEVRWYQAYLATQTWYAKLATEVPSATEQQTYAWMARIPALREWVGERLMQNAASYSYTLVNKDFELTEKVDKNKILDDQFGLYNPILDYMGVQTRKWPDYLIADQIRAGTTTLCFDNQNFFDTAHPVNLRDASFGTYSNNFTVRPLTYDNYAFVRNAMMAYRGEDGKPLMVVPNLLVVPPQLEGIGRQILMSELVAPGTLGGVAQVGGQTNIWRGTAELLVLPELSADATTWYLMDTSKPIRPFVFQLRQAAEFVYLNNPSDPNVFFRREFIFGVHTRGNAGVSLPFLAARAIA